MKNKKKPNILVIGNVASGKSQLCEKLCQIVDLQWLDVAQIALNNRFLSTFDEIHECPILDANKLVEGIDYEMERGNNVVEYHSCRPFPEKWFDLVIVVRMAQSVLYERLKKRGYRGAILGEILQNELENVCVTEALALFKKQRIVREVYINNELDLLEAAKQIATWYKDIL